MTYARRADSNQAEIVAAIRKCGGFVQTLHRVGQGCPDLLVGIKQRWFIFEVKRDAKAKHTQDQKDWIAGVAGRAPVVTITSALEAVGFLQRVQP